MIILLFQVTFLVKLLCCGYRPIKILNIKSVNFANAMAL